MNNNSTAKAVLDAGKTLSPGWRERRSPDACQPAIFFLAHGMRSNQEKKNDLATRVAWMYYVAKQTQQDIATALDLSRPTVNRLIAQATDRGLVTVRFNHPLGECVELAERLCKRFSLSFCEIAPLEPEFSGSPLESIATVGAAVLERYLADPKLAVLATGSGRTLRAVIDGAAEIRLPNLKVISITGSVALDGSFSRYNAGLRTADLTGGKHFLLPVPLVAESPEAKERWCAHELYHRVQTLYAQSDVALIGVGPIAAKCPMVEDGFITRQEAEDLVSLGAVGDVLGWPLDRNGKLVGSAVAERVTSMPLPTLASRPVIAFAGGEARVQAILAALRGHWISGLVTDQQTARRLLIL